MTLKDESQRQEFISQSGRAVLELRELLIKGEFRPGERLSELSLVARMGVSRTPVRLALDRLSHEGLLEPSPAGGFLVRQFTVADVWDAIELRGVLEGTAAKLAAERLVNDSELDPLRGYQSRMNAMTPPNLDTFGAYMDLNEAFHRALVRLAKSPMLSRSLNHVNSLPFASPSALVFARSKLPKAVELVIVGQEQHLAILDALARRQGGRAEAVAREHALLSRRNLETALNDEAVLESVPGASLIRST